MRPSSRRATARRPLPPLTARESETRFRTIFEQAAVGVSVIDAAGRIVDANGAFHAFLGYARGELIGVYAPELSPPEDAAVTRGPVAALRAGTLASATVEKRFVRRDGEIRWASLSLTSFPLPGGETGVLGMTLDVTEARRDKAALAASQARLELIYNSTSDLMFLMRVGRDARGAATYRCESVNEPYLAVTGLAREEVIERALEDFLPADVAAIVRARYDAVVASGDVLRVDEEWRALPTGPLVVETTLTPILDDAGACTHILGAARDVTARRRAEAALRESEARVRGAVEASLDALFVLRAVRGAARAIDDFEVVDCNARAAALWDATPEGIVGRRATALFPIAHVGGAEGGGMFDALRRVVETGEPHVHEYETAGLRTRARWAKLQAVRLGDGLAVTARDVTEQKHVEETLRGLALVDELTGVHNRRGFLAAAEREWQRAQREGTEGGALLVFIDLDDFKEINDRHGHAEGDRALRAVAEVLRGVFRGADVIGRLGGDEFAVLVASPGAGPRTAAEVDAVEARLRERLARQLAVANAESRAAGRPYDLAMSVGIASAPPPARTEGGGAPSSLAGLMAAADQRLYEEKRARAS